MTFTGFVLFSSTITLCAALEDRFQSSTSIKIVLLALSAIFIFKLGGAFLVFL